MTIDEIFSLMAEHMIEGLMTHAQLADFYNFLGLKGYQKCHEYHYFCENKNYRELCDYYLKYHGKLIKELPFKNPNIISKDWYEYDRSQVDATVRKTSIQYGIEKWVEWETATKEQYEKYVKELWNLGEIATASQIQKYLLDVSDELSHATQKWLETKAINYNISDIMEQQEECYKKYKKKLKEIKLC